MARLFLCGPHGTEFSPRLGRDGVCGANDAWLNVGRGSTGGGAAVVGGGSGTGAICVVLVKDIALVSVASKYGWIVEYCGEQYTDAGWSWLDDKGNPAKES